MSYPRRKFLRDLSKSLLWLSVAPGIIHAQNLMPARRVAHISAGVPHLLNSLVSYWGFNANDGTDSQDSNALSFVSGTFTGGIIGNSYSTTGCVGCGAYMASTPVNLRLGNGVSYTMQMWLNGSTTGVPIFAMGLPGSSSAVRIYLSGSVIQYFAAFIDVTSTTWNTGLTLPGSGWHQLIFGYKSSTKQMFASLDNGAMQFNTTTADISSTAGQWTMAADGTAIGDNIGIDECGFWNRVLVPVEITTLNNGGSAWPYANFTP